MVFTNTGITRKKMRYLITGAGGFIGRWLHRTLAYRVEENDVVVGISRQADKCYDPGKNYGLCYSELNNPQWVKRLLADLKPDVIFHFAGCATVSSPPDKIWSSNVDTTFNLLQFAPKGCRFILASSINAKYPTTVYAASKLSAESLVAAYSKNDLVKGNSVRLCAVAGAYNTHGVVKAVVEKFMKQDKVELLTDSRKPFTYVVDVVNYIINLAMNNSIWVDSHNMLELVPWGNISVSEIALITKKLIDSDKEYSFTNTSWSGDDNYVSYSPSLASEKVFGRLENSTIAVTKAIKDILKLEYGVNV